MVAVERLQLDAGAVAVACRDKGARSEVRDRSKVRTRWGTGDRDGTPSRRRRVAAGVGIRRLSVDSKSLPPPQHPQSGFRSPSRSDLGRSCARALCLVEKVEARFWNRECRRDAA